MTYHEFQNEFKTARILLSLGFMLLMIVIIAVYILETDTSLSILAAQAWQNPTEVVSGMIRGMAQR